MVDLVSDRGSNPRASTKNLFQLSSRRLNRGAVLLSHTNWCGPLATRFVDILLTMRRIHRIAGLLSALSLVALVMIASGFGCELPSGADHMAGMAMANPADAPSPVANMGSTTGEAPATDPAPCGLPWAPSGCQSMVACTPTAVASQGVGISATSGARVRVASVAVLTPSSETIAPELPPPRA